MVDPTERTTRTDPYSHHSFHQDDDCRCNDDNIHHCIRTTTTITTAASCLAMVPYCIDSDGIYDPERPVVDFYRYDIHASNIIIIIHGIIINITTNDIYSGCRIDRLVIRIDDTMYLSILSYSIIVTSDIIIIDIISIIIAVFQTETHSCMFATNILRDETTITITNQVLASSYGFTE